MITGMADDSPLMQEEIFGPIACVTPFDSKSEVGGWKEVKRRGGNGGCGKKRVEKRG